MAARGSSWLNYHCCKGFTLIRCYKNSKVCNNAVASHIATFSYRKSFRTAAYPAIWSEAENILANSKKWIFIGYSLPEADFELKHLIKNAELRFRHKKINMILMS
jgi:hypothetical protein